MTPCVHSDDRPIARSWKHGKIPVIGVIGGIGGGKSQLTELLAARGASVIDADAVGHELLADPEVCARVVDRFGVEVIKPVESSVERPPGVDRRALGRIVFANASARIDLEAILHPLMRRQFQESIARATRPDSAARVPLCVVLDAAILLEAGWDDLCDLVVFVDAPRAQRLQRVALERGWSQETLESRERAQWPNDQKRRRADLIITNNAGFDHLNREIDRLVALFQESSSAPPVTGAPDPQHRHGVGVPKLPVEGRSLAPSPANLRKLR